MGRDSERPGGFPWWVVSVMAAGLVLVVLVASRPAATDRVSVRSPRAASSRNAAVDTAPAPTTAPASKPVVVRSHRAAVPPPTTVVTVATSPPTSPPRTSPPLAPHIELPKTG
jgi:hypothetical protein